MIIFQPHEEYIKTVPHAWYSFLVMPRGWTDMKDIYIDTGAFFLGKRDKELLINHEQGHIDGKDHTWFGLMSPYGIVRYFTTVW